MIKIDDFFSNEIAEEYAKRILPCIKRRYTKHESKLSDEIKKKIFCDDAGNFSDEKVKMLLISKKDDLFSKDNIYKDHTNIPTVLIEYERLDSAVPNEEKKLKSKMKKAGFIDQSKYFEHLIKNAEKPFCNIPLPINTPKDFKKKIKETNDEHDETRNDVMRKIINYNALENIHGLRHKIISSLNVHVCPYCNRQYITSWEDEQYIKDENDKRRTTADLDHYYNKSDYPLFSLSLFNFIPSCQICNSRMKGQKTDRTLYPYEEGFGDDARFAIEPKDKKKEIDVWLGNKNAEFDIKIEISDSVNADKKIRIENSKKVFGLEKVYQAHKEYVRELIIKKRVYDEGSYSDNMAVIFEKLGLDYSEAELKRFLYGSVSPDSDRPLSKLTCDIIKK